MSGSNQPVAIVMAAGKSTRMKSELPKVLHNLCGRPLLSYVLDALEEAGIHRKLVVVGFGADQVRETFADTPGVEFVLQAEQKGTGHAVLCCKESLSGHTGPVVVLAGDGPMVRSEMLAEMLKRYRDTNAKAFMATSIVSDPTGLGRIVRDERGNFLRIVEQKDASPQEAMITEINPSFYCFDGPMLFEALAEVRPNNVQKEYYVTDVPGILLSKGATVRAEPIVDVTDMFGINSRQHLGEAHALMQQRILQRHMENGVTIVDPRNTYIDALVTIGKETVVLPFSVITGPTEIGSNCRIGPFAHIRPHTILADGVEVGAFVEVVRSKLGPASMARHLAYLGDAEVGAGVNVGAGVITANYDGESKAATKVADRAFLGSGAVLVAPVEIGEAAFVGAGAVLTKQHNVRPGEMVVGVPARPMHRKGS